MLNSPASDVAITVSFLNENWKQSSPLTKFAAIGMLVLLQFWLKVMVLWLLWVLEVKPIFFL